MRIINTIQHSCTIKDVVIHYCSLAYFSTLNIEPIYFKAYTKNGVEWGIANSISIEEVDSQYQIFFELDGMTISAFYTNEIRMLDIKKPSRDDFKNIKREYYDLFK